MGLTLSVGDKDLNMSYSTFNDLRELIAYKISKEYGLAFHNARPPIFGPWPECTNNNLKPLMDHSDCDGILTSSQCWDIGIELKKLGPIDHLYYNEFLDILEYTANCIDRCIEFD